MTRKTVIRLVSMTACITGLLMLSRAVAERRPIGARSEVSAAASTRSGEASVLLADGRRLFLGGGSTRPSANAYAVERTGVTVQLGSMQIPRAWHTATMLANGQVLILGGIGADGEVVSTAEAFDPASSTFSVLDDGPHARAFHTATVLLDGTVVIAGGVGDANAPRDTIQRWDPRTGASDEIALPGTRIGHTAHLLPDGEILLWGGVDAEGRQTDAGDLYDPLSGQLFLATEPPDSLLSGLPRLETAVPEDGAREIATDTPIGLRFSTPLAWPPDGDITLTARGRTVEVDLVPAEGGMEVFLSPAEALRPGTTYTLTIRGVADQFGATLNRTAIRFTTSGGASGRDGASDDGDVAPDDTERVELDERWYPDKAGKDRWRTGRSRSDWQSLPPLKAPKGVTALAGQVLRLNGRPITGVELQIGEHTTRTDSTGRFLLQRLPVGHAELLIDGGKAHGIYEVGVEVVAGVTTVLPYTIWLTAIDWANGIDLPTPTIDEVVVTTPRIPGLELRIPAGTTIRDHEGNVVDRISITPVPVDRPPFPLPGVRVPLYFTVQPGGAYVILDWGGSARLIYPNRWGDAAGTRYNFWNYDAEERGWHVYGQGAVTWGAKQIVPDPWVGIYEFSGAMVVGPDEGPQNGPPPGGCSEGSQVGDPVDLATGLLVMNSVDLDLPDIIPLTFTRTYRQSDLQIRPFGLSTTHSYEMFLVGDGASVTPTSLQRYKWLELVLPDGGRVRFDRVCPNVDGSACCTQADGTAGGPPCNQGLDVGAWEHTATPTRFHGARIRFAENATVPMWHLTLRDGTTYLFPDSDPSGPAPPFDQAGAALVGIRDRFGNSVSLTRDTGDRWYRLKRITSSNGRWIELSYQGDATNGYVIDKATDNAGRQVLYHYDGSRRLDQVTDVNGGVTKYEYHSTTERLHRISDARREAECAPTCPYTLTVDYWNSDPTNGNGTVKQETLADGTSTFLFSYNMVKRCNISTAQSCTLDSDCSQPTCPTCKPGERCQAISTATTSTDPNGRQRQDTFNATGYCLDRTEAFGDPLARTTTRTRQAGSNLITSVKEPLPATSGCKERLVEYGYFPSGVLKNDLQSVTTKSGPCGGPYTTLAQHAYDYEPRFHQLRSVTDPLGHATTVTYPAGDALARPTAIKDATNRTFGISVNSRGQVTSVTDPNANPVTFGYDGGDLVTITNPLNQTERRWFDAAGRVTIVTDGEGRTTRFEYFNPGWLKKFTDGLTPAGTIEFEYDKNGNLTKRTDNRHSPPSVTNYHYNALDLLDSRTDPLAPQAETFAYEYRNLIMHRDRRGNQTDWCYDARDRPRCVGFGRIGNATNTCATGSDCTVTANYDATLGGTIVYTNDVANRLTTAADSLAGTITVAYDDLDDVISELTPLSLVAYTYDAARRRKSSQFFLEPLVRYCYDDADRLERLVTGGDCTTSPGTTLVNITYDSVGRRQEVTLPNGAKQIFGYDAASRISSIQHLKPNASVLGALAYTYDRAGNRIIVGGQTAAPAFGLPNGLPTAVASASYNSADRILTWAGTSYGYDNNGNLTSDGTNTYVWNKRDQLVQITGGASASFAYDAFGRRREKILSGTTTKFFYDGLNVAYELSATNTKVATLINGLELDEIYERTDSTGAWAFHTDALGSTIDLLRADAGGATTQVNYSYEPYGRTTASAANGNAFQFTGRENDQTLYHYRSRYHSPLTGRFTSEDPIRFAGGSNLYRYVRNSPVNLTDPLGLTMAFGRPIIRPTPNRHIPPRPGQQTPIKGAQPRPPVQTCPRTMPDHMEAGVPRGNFWYEMWKALGEAMDAAGVGSRMGSGPPIWPPGDPPPPGYGA
jgi:RHS repeat-associated protein